jgi:hypothetical protein
MRRSVHPDIQFQASCVQNDYEDCTSRLRMMHSANHLKNSDLSLLQKEMEEYIFPKKWVSLVINIE